MTTRRRESRISRATHSSSPTDSTISSTTSRPKRQRDVPHRDDHSDRPRPSLTEYILDIPSPTVPRMSSVSTPEGPTRHEAAILDKVDKEISTPLFCDVCTVNIVFPSFHSTFEG
ncbi:hypothetical protein PIB30_037044 [Stylosanthes scabra]|uniref:Uncharacterized protein n=1 Tax=Stylosanthes scabra TaxID=79078 RepID=A0ABU6TDB3_9FABA|nr:hypothetical protein [Stylosanthes scabra]